LSTISSAGAAPTGSTTRPVWMRHIAHFLPDRIVSSDELARTFVDSEGREIMSGRALQRLTGIRERRYAAPGVGSSDLASSATVKLLAECDIRPEAIDTLISASASHDVAEPATANRLQHLSGCTRARVFDVKNACNSFLDGLEVAASLVACGRADHVVVATGEVISRTISTVSPDRNSVSDLLAGLTLGDAGAAALISASPSGALARVLPAKSRSIGSYWNRSALMAGGNLTTPESEVPYFVSDSQTIFELVLEHVPALVREALDEQGWLVDEIDIAIPHQASILLIRELAKACGFPFERCMVTSDHLGNTAAASIPVALSLALEGGRLQRARRVLLVGGAAGFSASVIPLEITG